MEENDLYDGPFKDPAIREEYMDYLRDKAYAEALQRTGRYFDTGLTRKRSRKYPEYEEHLNKLEEEYDYSLDIQRDFLSMKEKGPWQNYV